MRRLLLFLLLLLALASSRPLFAEQAEKKVPKLTAWVYGAEPFALAFDHDGDSVAGFYVVVDGTPVADVGVEALLPRTARLRFPAGLPVGTHRIEVETHDAAGVVTAKTDPLVLEVRERTGTGAATFVRIERGDQ